jgi:hypothetical protein
VVIDDLHVEGVGVPPHEADSPLIIDSNAVLALPLSLQRFEAIAGRRADIPQGPRGMEQQELPPRNPFESPVSRNVMVVKERIGRGGPE